MHDTAYPISFVHSFIFELELPKVVKQVVAEFTDILPRVWKKLTFFSILHRTRFLADVPSTIKEDFINMVNFILLRDLGTFPRRQRETQSISSQDLTFAKVHLSLLPITYEFDQAQNMNLSAKVKVNQKSFNKS